MCLRRQPIEAVAGYPERVAESLPYIYALCRRASRFRVYGVDPEDVVQEVVLMLLQHERYYVSRPSATWWGWVRLKARQAAHCLRLTRGWGSYHKVSKRRPGSGLVMPVQEEEEILRLVPDRPSADCEPRLPACRQRVRRAVRRLVRTQRRAILEVYWRGRPALVVDRANGLRLNTTSAYLAKGRRKLREILSDGVQP